MKLFLLGSVRQAQPISKGSPMKLALTFAAGLLAMSSMALAADNNGGDNNGSKDGMKDNMTTGSTQTKDSTGDLDDQMKCREGTGGGAPCQEMGTEIQQ